MQMFGFIKVINCCLHNSCMARYKSMLNGSNSSYKARHYHSR